MNCVPDNLSKAAGGARVPDHQGHPSGGAEGGDPRAAVAEGHDRPLPIRRRPRNPVIRRVESLNQPLFKACRTQLLNQPLIKAFRAQSCPPADVW